MTRALHTTFAAAFVALLSVSTWHEGCRLVDEVSSSGAGIARLTGGDSAHYLEMARAFSRGDFAMAWVAPTGRADRAHRQPGYPALLALAEALGADDAPSLARVNVAMLVAALWIAFAGARLATGSALAGALAAAVVHGAPFLFDLATTRLLTEPTYVAVALAACGSCLAYLHKPETSSLLLTAAFAAFAYVVRVNGLLLAASLGLAMVAADLVRKGRRPSTARSYALAAALFVAGTSPSWVPRLVHAGNPLYHGYLANYLWVDDYDRAHAPGPPRFSPSTYASEHSPYDAASRLGWGMQRVFRDTPRDKLGVPISLAAAGAIVVLVLGRSVPGLIFVIAGVLQALPLAWTALPNPARRLPAAALLPFFALVAAEAVAELQRRRPTRVATSRPSPSGNSSPEGPEIS